MDHGLLPKKKQRVQTYNEEYVKPEFIQCSSNVTKPQCLLCFKVLSNDAMKPTKMKRYLMSEHPEFANKPQPFFERKSKEYFRQKKVLQKSLLPNEKLLKASYLVTLRVVQTKSSHTIAENLILSAPVDMCKVVWDSQCGENLNKFHCRITIFLE